MIHQKPSNDYAIKCNDYAFLPNDFAMICNNLQWFCNDFPPKMPHKKSGQKRKNPDYISITASAGKPPKCNDAMIFFKKTNDSANDYANRQTG